MPQVPICKLGMRVPTAETHSECSVIQDVQFLAQASGQKCSKDKILAFYFSELQSQGEDKTVEGGNGTKDAL